MKLGKLLPLAMLAVMLTACGTQTESAPEEVIILTDPTETSAETESTLSPETTPVVQTETTAITTVTETETETEPETEPETETSSAEERAEDEAPYLLLKDDRVTVEPGGSADLTQYLSFGDDHDPHPTVEWTGSYDPNEPGTYLVSVTLTDSAGNTRHYDLTVDVPWETMKGNVTFDSVLSENPGCSCGIDVSKWQGDIDFDRVRSAGAEFVLMRVGYGDTGCESDAYFTQNFAGSKAAGLKRGVYFYSTAATPDAARKQADWIASQLGGEALDFPVAFDWENFKHFQDWGMSFDTLNAIYDAFSEQMRGCGYETMLYATPETLGKAWYSGKTVWLADYGAATDYTGTYYMRQAWNIGLIDGISGDVDVNIIPNP